jgi:hypothetical protein
MGANAQTTVPTFTAAQVLTADQMNQSARTGVPVFADTTARDAGFGGSGEKVLAEGQLCYLESTNVVQYYDGAAWATLGPTTAAVLQVKSTAKLDTFTTSSATFVDVTGLTVAITPSSASNKVLVIAQISHGIGEATPYGHFKLNGGNTSTYVGNAASNRVRAVFGGYSAYDGENTLFSESIVYLDSPATTSATTYAVQVRAGTSGSVIINASSTDADNASVTRGASSITAIEVTP